MPSASLNLVHSFIRQRTANSVKRKDGIRDPGRKWFVICCGSCRDSFWLKKLI